jgi:hypothetical protein
MDIVSKMAQKNTQIFCNTFFINHKNLKNKNKEITEREFLVGLLDMKKRWKKVDEFKCKFKLGVNEFSNTLFVEESDDLKAVCKKALRIEFNYDLDGYPKAESIILNTVFPTMEIFFANKKLKFQGAITTGDLVEKSFLVEPEMKNLEKQIKKRVAYFMNAIKYLLVITMGLIVLGMVIEFFLELKKNL